MSSKENLAQEIVNNLTNSNVRIVFLPSGNNNTTAVSDPVRLVSPSNDGMTLQLRSARNRNAVVSVTDGKSTLQFAILNQQGQPVSVDQMLQPLKDSTNNWQRMLWQLSQQSGKISSSPLSYLTAQFSPSKGNDTMGVSPQQRDNARNAIEY
jgi:hypothetical protein